MFRWICDAKGGKRRIIFVISSVTEVGAGAERAMISLCKGDQRFHLSDLLKSTDQSHRASRLLEINAHLVVPFWNSPLKPQLFAREGCHTKQMASNRTRNLSCYSAAALMSIGAIYFYIKSPVQHRDDFLSVLRVRANFVHTERDKTILALHSGSDWLASWAVKPHFRPEIHPGPSFHGLFCCILSSKASERPGCCWLLFERDCVS